MTRDKAYQMIEELKEVFDMVCLFDADCSVQYTISPQGEIKEETESRHTVWNRDNRCDNCISPKVFAQKTQVTKFEFINNDMYFVTTKYMEIDDTLYMLEMVSRIQDDSLFSGYGKEDLAQKLSGYGDKIYIDALTGVRNRTYYEECVETLDRISAIAMMGLDSFQSVNETFGFQVGDKVLKQVAEDIRSCVRSTDILVRYEGDEFVLVFIDITSDIFKNRLETIRQTIEQMTINGYPDLHITVSIGGYFTQNISSETIKKVNMFLVKAKETRNRVVVMEE